MTGTPTSRQNSVPPRPDRESFDSDSPHAEHVEVSHAPETRTDIGLNDLGTFSSRAAGPSSITRRTNILADPRAALPGFTWSFGQSDSQQSHEVPNTSSDAKATADPSHGIPFDPKYMTINISFGHTMPAPRWVLEPRATPRRLSIPQASAVAELEWVFDVGPYTHLTALKDTWLSEYAYRTLESALDDPIQRQHIRNNIWARDDDEYWTIEDPIPPLPSVPNTLDVTQQREGLTPGSVNERLLHYPNYERPSLAKRCLVEPPDPENQESGGGTDEEGAPRTPSVSSGTDDSSPDGKKLPIFNTPD
ncbi:hypothetical protein P170DRAFT_472940 [Aspergillus steynii IBT 23096]|uniref:Uncharacterized protein n=1 Tax=Aspergillus steynii IBT 23096 TaxID=1392250 RepID=A0A2I2GJK5_9EURO|nr:uncharacterized protein P170DRAFT_472940 [Aspergillus steynii IBT 23096]PLB53062.1 hypothetical protein P170DRAFT_472940 [Aspergillus steynii IBT 23096]